MATNPIAPRNLPTSTLNLELESSTSSPRIDNENIYNSYFALTVGEQVFDQRMGDILGEPFVLSITGQHDYSEIILFDPEAKYFNELREDEPVVIEAGNGDDRIEIMRGVISDKGREYPDGTILKITDNSSVGKNATPSIINSKTGDLAEDTEAQEEEIVSYSNTNTKGEQRQDLGTVLLAEKSQLNYETKSKIVTDQEGEILIDQDDSSAIVQNAKKVGDEIITIGDKLIRVPPEGGADTGIILDYVTNRNAFINRPRIVKKIPNQSYGSGGSWRVTNWNIDEKKLVGATVVTPPLLSYDEGQEIIILKNTVFLGQPIFANSLFTWGDATYGGRRIPDTEKILERIIAIAQLLDQLNRQYTPDEKWQIISWFNPNNESAGRHPIGDAVDFYTPRVNSIYNDLNDKYTGGLALYPDRFCHIDRRQDDGLPSLRWTF